MTSAFITHKYRYFYYEELTRKQMRKINDTKKTECDDRTNFSCYHRGDIFVLYIIERVFWKKPMMLVFNFIKVRQVNNYQTKHTRYFSCKYIILSSVIIFLVKRVTHVRSCSLHYVFNSRNLITVQYNQTIAFE